MRVVLTLRIMRDGSDVEISEIHANERSFLR